MLRCPPPSRESAFGCCKKGACSYTSSMFLVEHAEPISRRRSTFRKRSSCCQSHLLGKKGGGNGQVPFQNAPYFWQHNQASVSKTYLRAELTLSNSGAAGIRAGRMLPKKLAECQRGSPPALTFLSRTTAPQKGAHKLLNLSNGGTTAKIQNKLVA